MSKFFNEILKSREEPLSDAILVALQSEAPITTTPQTSTSQPVTMLSNAPAAEAATSPADSNDPVLEAEGLRAEPYRLAQINLSKVFRAQFQSVNSQPTAEESYRTLRTRLMRIRASQGLRSVVVTSAIQGEGKTLTSINLALCCARLHEMKVLVIDGDIRTSSLTRSLDLPEGPGLSDVLSGKCTAQEAISATDIPNLYVLASGELDKPPAELFAGERWLELIRWCNGSFGLVLIDSPPCLNLADVELILAACDGALVVVRALHTKREILQKCASQIDSKKLLGIVFNAVQHAAHNTYGYHYARSGTNLKGLNEAT